MPPQKEKTNRNHRKQLKQNKPITLNTTTTPDSNKNTAFISA